MRKDTIFTLNDNGRALKFKVHQMSATQTEAWLFKMAVLIAQSGKDVDIAAGSGFSAILSLVGESPMKLLAGLDYDTVKPLVDELMATCVRIEGNMELPCTDEILDGCIENVSTLFALRMAVVKANFDFFSAENSSDSPKSEGIVIGR